MLLDPRLRSKLESLMSLTGSFPSWFEPEFHLDRFQAGALEIHRAGASLRLPDGQEAVGSAAGRSDEDTLIRAFFELLERMAVILAYEKNEAEHICYDQGRVPAGSIPRSVVFPQPPAGASWQYAKTNGAAAHSLWERAFEAAAHELRERDEILSSWYGATLPQKLPVSDWRELSSLAQLYDFEAYCFSSQTVGVFGFPRKGNQAGQPLLLGFGSHQILERALAHASSEALQRYAFLFGEPLLSEAPEFRPHVDYHLDYYLNPAEYPKLRDWLSGSHFRQVEKPILPSRELQKEEPFVAVDITPFGLGQSICIVKAVSTTRIPLCFGLGNPKVSWPPPLSPDRQFGIHPIA